MRPRQTDPMTQMAGLDGTRRLLCHQRATSPAADPGHQALHTVRALGNVAEPVRHLVEAAMTAAHLASKTTAGRDETTIDTLTDRATTATTSALAASVAAAPVTLSAAANHATTRAAPLQRTAAIDLAPALAAPDAHVTVHPLSVAATAHAQEVQTASTDMYLGPAKSQRPPPLPLLQRQRPPQLLSKPPPPPNPLATAANATTRARRLVNAMILAIATGVIAPVSMIAGKAGGLAEIDSMRVIDISPVEAEMTREIRRKSGVGVGVEIEMVGEIGGGVGGVGVARGIGIGGGRE
jgi:hypothetical protein